MTKPPRPLAELCAELDRVEALSGNRVGGPDVADMILIRMLEDEIGERPADSLAVTLWRVERLVRAVLNGWRRELAEPLARALERDVRAFGP